jgi:hypothetical protein
VRLVTDYIDEPLPVGAVDEPAAYFRGTLPMRWHPLATHHRQTVLFGSVTPTTLVGLCGSLRPPGDRSPTPERPALPGTRDSLVSSRVVLSQLEVEVVPALPRELGTDSGGGPGWTAACQYRLPRVIQALEVLMLKPVPDYHGKKSLLHSLPA